MLERSSSAERWRGGEEELLEVSSVQRLSAENGSNFSLEGLELPLLPS